MNRQLHTVAENLRRLATTRTCSTAVREQATEVGNLLALVATWPVPPSLNIEEEIGMKLAELCRSSGFALCKQAELATPGGCARGTQCPIARPQ